jgi:selenide,water dikinase
MLEQRIKLTSLSHGAGCGCKIAPAVLRSILEKSGTGFHDPRLIVDHSKNDDAAVLDLGNGRALISTTDFFSPIVDDPFDFGRVAATNALSDVYAMGGRPILAIAILGWPVEKLPVEMAAKVIEGARKVCGDAHIALAGGHSIDAPEPFFGLAVTGEAALDEIRTNSNAKAGDLLALTKPLGTGVLSTAMKRGIIQQADETELLEVMCQANSIGAELGKIGGVHAMTDVTGFGLLGHLLEMCDGSNVSASLEFSKIPRISSIMGYISQGCYADGALRNWKSISPNVLGAESMEVMMTLADPQTSGGLLISFDPQAMQEISALFDRYSIPLHQIGRIQERDLQQRTIVIM